MRNALGFPSYGILLCSLSVILACEKTRFSGAQPAPSPTSSSLGGKNSPSTLSPGELNNSSSKPSGGNQYPAPVQGGTNVPTGPVLPVSQPVSPSVSVGGVTYPPGVLPPKGGTQVVPGLGGKPVVSIPPKVPFDPPSGPTTTVPAGKVLVQLRIAQISYDSWWKNCLTVTVGSDTKDVGCNKTTPLNTVVEFLADKDVCNRLDVRVKTYFPESGACKPGFFCNGPYVSTVAYDRSSSEIPSAGFFRAYDRNNIMARDPLIAIQDSTAAIKQEMDAYSANTPQSRWVRVYFEDQSSENLDAVLANPTNAALREERAIDFNDYVFDVRAQGVEFYIAGLEPRNCTRK